MTPPVCTVDLHQRFGRTEALSGVDLEVAPGTIFGLVGPNGAGKTTLLKTLVNILAPASGHAELLGVDSRRLGPAEFQLIGYVSENQDLPDWMTVDDLTRYLRCFYAHWDDAMAETLLARFELPRERPIRHLSRGMRMKVALASSLAYHPTLLLLDEPFSGLDALVRDELVDALLDGADETTILISSHELGEIETFVTHVGFLEQGRLRFSQRLEDLSARFREIHVRLLRPDAVPAAWPQHWLDIETAPGLVRFVDSDFDAQQADRIAERFGQGARVEVTPMSLRAIFVVLAKHARAGS